ncbi:MAG: argB [Vampirovibrio sp.]|jgi:acetylglutamate kinase|nr:argB [Vampirovibrio sp.]
MQKHPKTGDIVSIMTTTLNPFSEIKSKTIVIKYGGSALGEHTQVQPLFQEIATLQAQGIQVLLVHGGGPQISQMLSRLQIESKHIDGLRITDQETVEVAEMVLCGSINKRIVSSLQRVNVNALGLSGKDLNLFSVKPKKHASVNLGYFGDVETINTSQISFLLSQPLIPVIAPIGTDVSGATFMLDADHLASQIASALQADKLFILTNVAGVLRDATNNTSVINALSSQEAEDLLNQGHISGGMIPKLQSCIDAVKTGVSQAYIFNGETANSLLMNASSTETIGTVLSL